MFFPMTTTPLSDTVKRLRSRSRSTPIRLPGGTLTFLSMIALRMIEPAPIVTLSSRGRCR